jgi:hypothetical protein
MATQQDRLISADNHIDLTYLPPDLWSAQAPGKWKLLAPRTELLDDGLHWFVEAQDKGMWNGVGPGFLPYTKGSFGHIDEMRDAGFEWNYQPGAKPRPTTPELRLADLDRDGLDAEIIYGCLMINEMIADPGLRTSPSRAAESRRPCLPGESASGRPRCPVGTSRAVRAPG